jgi:YHS domain-containing protein
MIRLLLFVLLAMIIARAFWRFIDGLTEGLRGAPRGNMPTQGVGMVRDPVCGTFVVPDRALSIGERDHRVFFCSTECRDKYRRDGRVRGRTA